MATAWIRDGKKQWEEEKNEMSLPRKLKDFLQWMKEKQGFRPFRLEDRAMVDQYSRESVFFDLSFTNFWAWEEVFHYCWKMVGDTLAVVYICLLYTSSRKRGDAVVYPREPASKGKGPRGGLRS